MAITSKLRFEIFKRDNFTCQYCGRKTPEVILEIDHVIPSSKGGDDDESNLSTSCFECNRGKSNTLLDTIIKDKDIHLETILLAERELQLKEYNYIREMIRGREDEELSTLRSHFSAQFNYPDYAENEFDKIKSFIRKSLKIMSYIDIMDLIDYAIEKTQNDSRGEYHNVAAAKYLAGILRNKLKDKTEDKND